MSNRKAFQPEEIRQFQGVRCDPELFSWLIAAYDAAASGKMPIGDTLIGRREHAVQVELRDSSFNRGMVAVLSQLNARGVRGPALQAYLVRTMGFLDLIKEPGHAEQFVRLDEVTGRISVSEFLIKASATADYEFPADNYPRVDTRSALDHARRYQAGEKQRQGLEAMALEAPCTCGSGRKRKNCCARRTVKPRSISLKVSLNDPVTVRGFSIAPDGAVRLISDEPMDVRTAYVETTYARAKGDKVVNRVPVDPEALSVRSHGILSGFDTIFAIDTNTRNLGSGVTVSVMGIVLATWEPSFNGMLLLRFGPTQAIELRNVNGSPDLVAWRAFFELLEASAGRENMGRTGVIVDAHLDALDAMNGRRAPIIDDFYVPSGCTLIYASSDAGRVENIANKLLSLADKLASDLLNELDRTGVGDEVGVLTDITICHVKFARLWNLYGKHSQFNLENETPESETSAPGP